MLTPLTRTQDGTIIGPDGRILFFSAERFTRDICEGTCCFICEVDRRSAEFNNEHILPNWMLRRYNLHGQAIFLPNGRQHQYGTYTIPCCVACNSLLSRELETPLSEVLGGGLKAVADHLMKEGTLRLFCWMALIFLKTHLKDATLRQHASFKDGGASIAAAENYQWEIFHYIHCLVRAVYLDASVMQSAVGSLHVLPAGPVANSEPFDFIDLSVAQTLVIRMGDFVLCAVFDDACGVMSGLSDIISRIKGPLSPPQIREVAAHMACCNMHLQNRPVFRTRIENGEPPQVFIEGSHDDKPVFARLDYATLGQFLQPLLGSPLPKLVPERDRENAARLLSEGKFSFLFDNDGEFIAHSPVPDRGGADMTLPRCLDTIG